MGQNDLAAVYQTAADADNAQACPASRAGAAGQSRRPGRAPYGRSRRAVRLAVLVADCRICPIRLMMS